MKYVHPHSMTWWSGVCALAIGIAMAAGVQHDSLSTVGQVLSALAGNGDASPASLIVLGLGLIGLRDKLERG